MSRRRTPRSTVPASRPAKQVHRSTPLPRAGKIRRPPARVLPPPPPPRAEITSLVAPQETSLADIIDSLLNRGVVLNVDLILALADVDLVYVRLSALLCAADRILPPRR
jgi:hypothetical protein